MKSGAGLLRDYHLRGYPKIFLIFCKESNFLTILGRTLAHQFSVQGCQFSEWLLQLHWAVYETLHLPLPINIQSESGRKELPTRKGSGTFARHNWGLKKDKLAHVPHIPCFAEGRHSLFRKQKVSFNTLLSWCGHIWESVAACPYHQLKDSADVTVLDIKIEQERKKKILPFLHQLEGKTDQPVQLFNDKM